MNYPTAITFATLCFLAFCGCSEEPPKLAPAGAEPYADYLVLAEEGKEAVTIRAQFRRGGPQSAAQALPANSSITLDGLALPGDSVGKVGTFYEVQKRLDEFAGAHRLDFTSGEGKTYSMDFNFAPFTLAPLPSRLSRENLQFSIAGLEDGTQVHLILTDTSFSSNDLNTIDTVRDGRLVVSSERLQDLRSGPVQLQLIREGVEEVRSRGKTVGRLNHAYSLHREFELKD